MSSLSTTISITTLIQEFNADDLKLFKEDLLKQLNINNEAEFIRNFLTNTHARISQEILDRLQTTAEEIHSKSNYQITSNTSDALNRLPNNIITHLAQFLTFTESVAIGYTNRRLYVESQKKSFLLKRREGSQIPIDLHFIEINRILASKSKPNRDIIDCFRLDSTNCRIPTWLAIVIHFRFICCVSQRA